MDFIFLDYALFLAAFLLLPIVIPSLLKGPIATFDEIMPMSDVEKSSAFLCALPARTRCSAVLQLLHYTVLN